MAEPSVEDPAEAVRASVLAWATEQDLWKQEALRRVLQSEHTADDIEAVRKALLAHVDEESTTLKPLTLEDLGGGCGTEAIDAINELKDVSRTNRLADGQVLKFGSTGMTVVYGHNGSGKSGYARVFKRACGARDSEKILPNVYAQADGIAAAATFTVSQGDKQFELNWSDDIGSVAELTCVGTFDSKNAPFYVEKKAGLSYIPYGLGCFQRLADLLDALSNDVDTALSAIRAQCAVPLVDPPYPPFVEAFLNNLVDKSDEEIDKFLSWDASDQKELELLAGAAKNPEGKAAALGKAAGSLQSRKDDLKAYITATNAEAVAAAGNALADALTTRKAADLAADAVFAEEPLKGVGDAAWLKLFNAAAEYSINVAYPGRGALATDPGDRCVLCHRELDEEARVRFQRFKDWVQHEAQQKADAAEVVLTQEKARYAGLAQTLGVISIDASVNAEAPEVAAAFGVLKTALAERLDYVTRVLGGDKPDEEPASLSTDDLTVLDTAVTALEKSQERILKLIAQGSATELADRASALEKRQALSQSSQAVKERRARLLALARYEKVKPLCSTLPISRKGGELLRQHVTARLEVEFEKAREDFDILDLEVRFSATSKKGGIERAIDLTQNVMKTTPNFVLSEGEHRAVALAGFLAEAAVSPGRAPIMVDDPVSSLDHRRRERVANRLAREAQDRQIIVFTHDVVFLVMLEEACTRLDAPLTRVMIERGGKSFGVVSDEPAPWDALKFGERRNVLEQKLNALRKHHQEHGEGAAYHVLVTTFYDRLRKTWERGVEELVLNDAIKRFRFSIQTMRLKEVAVDDEVYEALDAGMAAASKLTGHDQAESAGGALPSPQALSELLEQLKSFETLVRKKSAAAKVSRSAVAKAEKVGA